MIILGIDPGLATTGYGLIQKSKAQNNQTILSLVDFGCIRTKAGLPIAQRLHEIKKDLEALIKQYSPHKASIEKIFFNTNITTGINVSQARGVMLESCFAHGVEILEFTPLQVKNNIVGNGQAEKKQVQYMVQKILKLDFPITQDDSADALALAIMASDTD